MRRTLSAAFCALLVACSGGDNVVVQKDQTPADTRFEETHQPDAVELVEETRPLDLVIPDELYFDAREPDESGPACAPGEGCFLDPCADNADCQAGWCVDHMGESVCSQLCQEECPQGWSCQQVGGGGPDVVWVCISDYANLCKPCATTEGCKAIGGAEDVCVDYGPDGNFCGGTCETDTDCPWGFLCSDVVTVDGVGSRQCVAEAGICPCTDKSIALALTTPCEVTNEFGTCVGQRVCAEEGLSACDAPEPGAETCDGVDNDCDGEVDEGLLVEDQYVSLCDDGNPCTKDQCLGETGCQNTALTEGECLDGNPCTVADHCVEGVCVGEPVDCDDGNPCTEDLCTETGGCEHPPAAAECDDQDPCTLGDHCVDGLCLGEAVNCACFADADCAALEDGNLCNGTLVCDTSALPYQCVVDPETVVVCPDPAPGTDAICQQAACDPATGACGFAPANEGMLCDDGAACTVGDHCAQGTCTSGEAILCNDGNPCTADSCDDAVGCVYQPTAGACDDGNLCTTDDQCADGKCSGGSLLDCDDDNLCTTDGCNPGQGCFHNLNEVPCNDGSLCTVNDHCHLGECIGGGQLSCNDNNPCTADSCNPASGCQFVPTAGDCDDGTECTVGDHCSNGQCVATGYLACDDGDLCTDDACDPNLGCIHTPNAAPCDDENACTTGDQCAAGTCVGGPELVCGDGNPCTDDSCDPATGCLFVNNQADCDDSNKCTPFDQCLDGQCVGSGQVDCDDTNPCTDDSCAPETGCLHSANAAPCNDGDVCTVGDICGDASCQPGAPLDCDDGDDCTIDTCDPIAGCLHEQGEDCCGNGQLDPGEQCDDGNDNNNDYCDNNCQFAGAVFHSYASANRTVYIFKSNSSAALSTYNTFCESLGLNWFVPKSQSDAQKLITDCYNLDQHHTWIITRNTTSAGKFGPYNVTVDDPGCVAYSNSGFSAIRKWACSYCEPENHGVTKCWDGDHVYDWLVCEGN